MNERREAFFAELNRMTNAEFAAFMKHFAEENEKELAEGLKSVLEEEAK